ncbi:MAG TPA: branched-chain amino acid aminotransferase, partial [Chryseolinea sp.]
ERNIRPEEVEGADSAFLCGTASEIDGVDSVDAKPFRLDWFDSLGASIQEAYKCQVREKSFSYVII